MSRRKPGDVGDKLPHGRPRLLWLQIWRRGDCSESTRRRWELSFGLARAMLRQVRHREGRYLLCANPTDRDPAGLRGLSMQLAQIEAHIFVAVLAYALHARCAGA